MIQKLLAGVSLAAVAVVALLLVTVGHGSAKPAEAKVASISTTTTQIADDFYAQLHIIAEDDIFCNPNCSDDRIVVTASAGDFVEYDPTFFVSGCYDEFFQSCAFDLDSNGFNSDGIGDFDCDDDLFGPGDTTIAIYTDGSPCDNNYNTTEIELWWHAPEGFDGGNVTFTACQDDVCNTSTIVVVGSVSSITLKALRDSSNQSAICSGTPVYVIGAVEYSYNDLTTFDNSRAIICADARDNNNTPVAGAAIIWTVTGGGCLDDSVTFTGSPGAGLSETALRSCSTGNMGDVATVTATSGSGTASVQVQFGGNPATCSLMFAPDQPLDIGDTGHITATFLDSSGHWVPDGIIAHLVLASSGDSSGNASLVSVTEDTVKGNIQGDVIAAIPGVVVVAASIEHIAGPDTTCSDELELTGDIHTVPIVCADPDMILAGFPPPPGGGFGTFEFCGGTFEQLFDASNCPGPMSTSKSAFFYNKPSGTFAVWVPGSQVAAVNAEIMALWPEQIPPHTIFTAKCV